jgi:hypothetical protein
MVDLEVACAVVSFAACYWLFYLIVLRAWVVVDLRCNLSCELLTKSLPFAKSMTILC